MPSINLSLAYDVTLYCPFCGKGNNGALVEDGPVVTLCAHLLIVLNNVGADYLCPRLVRRAAEHEISYTLNEGEFSVGRLVSGVPMDEAANNIVGEDGAFDFALSVRDMCETFPDVVILDQMVGPPSGSWLMIAFAPVLGDDKEVGENEVVAAE